LIRRADRAQAAKEKVNDLDRASSDHRLEDPVRRAMMSEARRKARPESSHLLAKVSNRVSFVMAGRFARCEAA
jgi:hypothetical protein